MSARPLFGITLAACSAVALAACEGTRADTGLDATLRVEGAQFFRGAPPASRDTPKVQGVTTLNDTVTPGLIGKSMKGALDPGASAVAIGARGDKGYWVLPARPPEVQTPTFPSFDAMLSVSPNAALGPLEVEVRAVDESGRFGPPTLRPMVVMPTDAETSRFVVALRWDTNADLDLHLTTADGKELFYRDKSSLDTPKGAGHTDDDLKKAAILDFDSNALCTIDGRRRENAIFRADPPKGRYVARVDTFSLCGEAGARWTVEAFLDGSRIGSASGVSVDFDTRAPHDRGAGVIALEIDVP